MPTFPLHRPRLTRFSSVRASVQLIPVSALRCQGPVQPAFEWFIQPGHSVPVSSQPQPSSNPLFSLGQLTTFIHAILG
ncbi:uncharacterized protein BO96DRAFT_414625 [Aspergillus niger CBS 101883]|uniref:uncharacterized protein n=1 Tax=Aspergillus lacticoffeatus (strain CBS 101883) TaxID=1450533 RepID=UPI000D7FC2EA|nr:uncharacterized protein BO96DRAFT_414625 [Aspergillus niger CBS 101883]PYH53579.1 hypothetical protein BO96DRAFT_414625 [Aspergillus niger CBS 101883]